MELFVGGRGQGKTAYVLAQHPRLTEEAIFDGRTDEVERLMEYPVIIHFADLVRRLMLSGEDPEKAFESLAAERPDIILVSEEIGSGIIPTELFEEDWREVTGRLLCAAARKADRFERVVCEYGIRIK